jgi:hypothetical protein
MFYGVCVPPLGIVLIVVNRASRLLRLAARAPRGSRPPQPGSPSWASAAYSHGRARLRPLFHRLTAALDTPTAAITLARGTLPKCVRMSSQRSFVQVDRSRSRARTARTYHSWNHWVTWAAASGGKMRPSA